MSRDLGGKTAGGFKLGDVLAKGGSSTVYAAEQTATGQEAAVKVYSYDCSRDKNATAKLVADVQKATATRHKNLVAVREVGTIENKGKRYLYVAMERLRGESLKARLGDKRQALPLHVALQIAGEVGGALQALQRADAAHGHLGPGSVFLVPPSEDERRADPEAEDHVYLLDLGTALVPVEESKDGGKDGGKASKSPKPPKPQDDVRGLAQLVVDMLGGPPTSVAAGRNAVLPLRWHNRKVPARIDAVLRQALSDGSGPDRFGRIESVSTLLAELLGVGDTQPTLHAWSEDGRVGMPKPPRNWNLTWAAGLALLGGAAVGYYMYTQDTPPPPPAVVDLAMPAPVDLSGGSALDLGSALLKDSPAAGVVDAGAADLRARVWPRRTGPKIPPLREADPAAAAPAATGSKTATPPSAPSPAGSTAATGAASTAAPKSPPSAATNPQPTGSPGASPPPARPARAQEVK